MSIKSSSQKELRCFIGIQIPANIKKAMATESKNMQSDLQYADYKWVKKSNYHLTLHFLGEIPLHKVVELKDALEKSPIIREPMQLHIKHISGFPTAGNAKFIAAELEESPALEQLQRSIKLTLDYLDIDPGTEAFRPHISLARLRRGHTAPKIGQVAQLDEAFELSDYAVFKSTLTPEGSIYEVIGHFGTPKPVVIEQFVEPIPTQDDAEPAQDDLDQE